jgi:glucokinase
VILAADIGGTNARVALFQAGSRTPLALETHRTEAWNGADDLLRTFLASHRVPVSAACVAVAGPVQDGRSRPINLPWSIDRRQLEAALDIPTISVVNDLEANARGIAVLDRRDLAVVNPGDPGASGNRAVVSAGTGLGEAALWWDGDQYHALAGEGGHADFAPRSDLEIALLRYLTVDYGHVSYERVCSGGGLVNIYRFLRDGGTGSHPSWLEPQAPPPSPASITAEAAADPLSLAAKAVGLFVSIYGARAANVALAFMATGGVYLGGGIAPRMVNRLAGGTFMSAFTAKGRLSPLLDRIPVYVVLNDRAALLGAAEIAAEHDLHAGRVKLLSLG